MPLAPLASTTDLLDRYADADGNLSLALSVASEAVREAAGAAISSVTSTVTQNALRDPSETHLPLPGPITAVASVTIAGAAVTDYQIEESGLFRRAGWYDYDGQIVATFTHGLATVPADIVDLTCVLAKAWLDHVAAGGGSTAGLASVRIDDAAESYTDEAAGQVSPVFIPAVTRTWLANRFGAGAQVVSFR